MIRANAPVQRKAQQSAGRRWWTRTQKCVIDMITDYWICINENESEVMALLLVGAFEMELVM